MLTGVHFRGNRDDVFIASFPVQETIARGQVSVDVEDKLFYEAKRRGITCITLSQRLALVEHHTQQLKIGEPNAAGWTLTQLQDGKHG